MTNLAEIQSEMFQKEDVLIEMADVFGALASDCRLEIIYLLLRVDVLPSGEIGRLTNCSPSQVSQYLSKMHDAGIVKKSRTWREVEYSLDKSDPFVQGIIALLSVYMK
jgi:predicted transcriptional regulator